MADRLIDRTRDAPTIERPQRTGTTRIERRAVARVREQVACMPASLVVQLALWPDELARWARAERIAESVVYNLLAARKPYHRMRERLAAHLGVQTGYLTALVDGAPATSPEEARRRAAAPPSDVPTERWRARTGANPLERRAVEVVGREIAAMPAATVVGLVLWPETLTEWSRAHGVQPSAVWATLAGAPSEVVTTALARRLDVSVRELVALIEAERRPAGAAAPVPDGAAADRTEALPSIAVAPSGDRGPGAGSVAPRPRGDRPPSAPPPDQLSLGL